MTRTILQGPAAVKYAGYTYYTEGDVTLTPQTQLRTIESSLHGPVSHRQTDRAVEVAFTPVGMLDSKDAYYPHGPAKLGALLAPGTDAPVYVHTAAGVKLTLKAGVVTRMPDLRLGAGLGPLGEMAITAMGGLGKATGEDESVWESESASLPADSLDASKILTPGYLLKLKSGSTTVHTLDAVEGIEVSLGARIEPVAVNAYGTVNYRLAALDPTVALVPCGLDEAAALGLLRLQDAGALGSEATLGLTLSVEPVDGDGITLTFPDCALSELPQAFGNSSPRMGRAVFRPAAVPGAALYTLTFPTFTTATEES